MELLRKVYLHRRPVFTWVTAEKRASTALPTPGTKVISAFSYGRSLWGSTAKVICRLPNGSRVDYFLKVLPLPAKSLTINVFALIMH